VEILFAIAIEILTTGLGVLEAVQHYTKTV
jgi:hypothetical protein